MAFLPAPAVPAICYTETSGRFQREHGTRMGACQCLPSVSQATKLFGCILMECCEGGELFNVIQEDDWHFPLEEREAKARKVFLQLVDGFHFLQSDVKLCHRESSPVQLYAGLPLFCLQKYQRCHVCSGYA